MGTAAPGPGNTRLRDNTITSVADSDRHADHRHALSHDFRILTAERLVAHFKNWKIFHTDYRRPYRTYGDAFDAARGLFFFSITWGFE
jgi:hypothetical protein